MIPLLLPLLAADPVLALRRPLDPSALEAAADLVVEAEVTGTEAAWSAGGEIETRADLAVLRLLRGSEPEGGIVVIARGGARDGVALRVEDQPDLRPDARYRLVLARRDDGTFRVLGGEAGVTPLGPIPAWNDYPGSMNWQMHPIEDPFRVNADSFPADAGGPDLVESAVFAALDTWTAAGVDLALVHGERTDLSGKVSDGHWVVSWLETSPDGTMAEAGIWFFSDWTPYDCDIRFYGNDGWSPLSWDADPDGPAAGRLDVQATTLHEAGHCIGFDHSHDPDAVMYPAYLGHRALGQDELDGLAALFDAAPVDADGDGAHAGEGDCDDADPAVYPGAPEDCDGADDDCDGVVDAQDEVEVTFAADTRDTTLEWRADGNAARADAPGRLVAVRQHLDAPEGTRLAWTVYEAEDASGPWTLVHSAVAWAVAGGWQESPPLDVILVEGRAYSVALGAMDDEATAWYTAEPDLSPRGPITPLGNVSGQASGNANGDPTAEFLSEQAWVVIGSADPDGDGVTGLCGDCDDADPAVYPGALEDCDGSDDDCDGEVDEDGACADGGSPADTASDGEDPGGCGCTAPARGSPGTAPLLLLAALALRRRRPGS